MTALTRSTDFEIQELLVDGIDIKNSFFSLEIYENMLSSAITGTVVVVEATSNDYLFKSQIKGTETIEFIILTPEDHYLEFSGFVNRISDRLVGNNGVTTYNIEFVSSVIRSNESSFITKRFKNTKPQQVIDDCIDVLNDDNEIPIETDIGKADGQPMNFIASRWHPIRTIQYVQKHGVPILKGGQADDPEDSTKREARGYSGFLFWESLSGIRYGSVVDLLRGQLGKKVEKRLSYTLANRMQTPEQTRNHILSYNNVQNNDLQTQQRSGAIRSVVIGMDLDKGQYIEQSYETDLSSNDQRAKTKKPTRVFCQMIQNEAYSSEPEKSQSFAHDQTLLHVQQTVGAIQNSSENICQLTLPIRPDIHVGDQIEVEIFRFSASESDAVDQRFSGDWIVTGIAHHCLLEKSAAYSRLTCARDSRKPEGNPNKLDLVGG